MTRIRALIAHLRTRPKQVALLITGVMILIIPSATSVLTNTITMAGKTTADYQALPVDANTLKPKACDAINLTNVVTGGGATIEGTAGNDLMLATTPTGTRLNGNGGSDCLVIGNGGTLDGGGPALGDTSTDICIGGIATVYLRCETTQNN